MPIPLSLDPFNAAMNRLQEGLARYETDTTDAQIRDGLIQRFEFTYEQSHKMLKRFLEMVLPSSEELGVMSFPDLIRTGNEQGLLRSDWSSWKKYREMRGKTSHTYDESIALEVVAGIPDFIKKCVYLLNQLSIRIK